MPDKSLLPTASPKQWQQDQAMLARARNGDQKALEQLCETCLRHVLTDFRTNCPGQLTERFYKAACIELAAFIRVTEQTAELSAQAWTEAMEHIQGELLGKLQSAGWDWMRVVLTRVGSITAEDELLRKYMPSIARMAKYFSSSYPEIVDDLAQEGQIWLRDKVLPEYKPEMGFTLWEFAKKIIWRKMRDECRAWAKERVSEPVYRRVTRTYNALQKHMDREPTMEQVALASGESESDVREVVSFGRVRRETSLDANWDDPDETPSFEQEDWGANPTHTILRRARYEIISIQLNENAGPYSQGHEGEMWLILFALQSYEEYTWEDIAAILAGSKPIDWASVHEAYSLPDSVPFNLAQMLSLFSDGPKLTADNLKRWYSRRSGYLAKSLDRHDL